MLNYSLKQAQHNEKTWSTLHVLANCRSKLNKIMWQTQIQEALAKYSILISYNQGFEINAKNFAGLW